MPSYNMSDILTTDNVEVAKFIKGHEIIETRLSNRDANLVIISKAASIDRKNKQQYQITRAFILGQDASGLKIAVSVDYYGDDMGEALANLLRVTA